MLSVSQLQEIEDNRQRRVIVLAATNLEIDLLPPLYETLREIGRVDRLDVVLYCRGGVVNAARRLALLLRTFTDHLSFLVPYYCESAGTVMSLAAPEIIAGPLAIFSPVDPLLTTFEQSGENTPLAISTQDVRLFSQMSKDWFGLDDRDFLDRSFTVLCDNIFPTTLSSFYRSTLELQDICAELLALHMPESTKALQVQIIDKLLFGYHSHSYAVTREEMKKLGLPIQPHKVLEDLISPLACSFRTHLGSGVRNSPEEDWFDTLIATRDGGKLRRQRHKSLTAVWESIELR